MDNKEPKFEFVEDDTIDITIEIAGVTEELPILTRIRLLRDLVISPDKTLLKGTLGGYLESMSNLSQEGTCWVDEESIVYGDLEFHGKSFIQNSWITGLSAKITDTDFINVKLLVPNLKIVNEGIYSPHKHKGIVLHHKGNMYHME